MSFRVGLKKCLKICKPKSSCSSSNLTLAWVKRQNFNFHKSWEMEGVDWRLWKTIYLSKSCGARTTPPYDLWNTIKVAKLISWNKNSRPYKITVGGGEGCIQVSRYFLSTPWIFPFASFATNTDTIFTEAKLKTFWMKFYNMPLKTFLLKPFSTQSLKCRDAHWQLNLFKVQLCQKQDQPSPSNINPSSPQACTMYIVQQCHNQSWT